MNLKYFKFDLYSKRINNTNIRDSGETLRKTKGLTQSMSSQSIGVQNEKQLLFNKLALNNSFIGRDGKKVNSTVQS